MKFVSITELEILRLARIELARRIEEEIIANALYKKYIVQMAELSEEIYKQEIQKEQ